MNHHYGNCRKISLAFFSFFIFANIQKNTTKKVEGGNKTTLELYFFFYSFLKCSWLISIVRYNDTVVHFCSIVHKEFILKKNMNFNFYYSRQQLCFTSNYTYTWFYNVSAKFKLCFSTLIHQKSTYKMYKSTTILIM